MASPPRSREGILAAGKLRSRSGDGVGRGCRYATACSGNPAYFFWTGGIAFLRTGI